MSRSSSRLAFERWIGSEAAFFRTPLGGRSVRGWMSTADVAPHAAEDIARRCIAEAAARELLVFGGVSRRMIPTTLAADAARLYCLSTATAADAVEFCDGGVLSSYNYPEVIRHAMAVNPDGYRRWRALVNAGQVTVEAMAGDPPIRERERVRRLLAAIHARQPFTVAFASQDLLRAVFDAPVDLVTSNWIEQRIVRAFPMAAEMNDPPMPVAGHAHRMQVLQIAWRGVVRSITWDEMNEERRRQGLPPLQMRIKR